MFVVPAVAAVKKGIFYVDVCFNTYWVDTKKGKTSPEKEILLWSRSISNGAIDPDRAIYIRIP